MGSKHPRNSITTDNAFPNYLMTCKLQSTLEASGIEWPALRNHIPYMVHIVQLTLGAVPRRLGVKGHTISWAAHEQDQQFGENETIDIGKSQRLPKEGNAAINKVSAMKPGLLKIIEIVGISWYFESTDTDLFIAENACGIDYTNTWMLKWVHWLSKRRSLHCSTSNCGFEDMLDLNTGIAQVHLLFTGIHMLVGPKSTGYSLPAPFHNLRWMDNCEVCDGSIETISILDPVDVKEAYSHVASCQHSI